MSAPPPRRLLVDTVRDRILEPILDGSMPVGAKLAAEPELSVQHGVSRATIREAVRGLVEEGYLSRVHGSGTYVAFRPTLRHSLERNLSYSRLIEQAGFRPGRRLVSVDRVEASVEDAKRLGLASDDQVVRVERVRSADERPVIYSIDSVPMRYMSDVADDDLGGSLYDLFGRLGHEVAHGEATLAPTLATGAHTRHLGVDEGSPLLYIAQVDYTTAGEAVMFSREWHVPGVFELSLLRRPT